MTDDTLNLEGLPEPVEPASAMPPGLGHDAARTWRAKQVIENGKHPATKLPLAPRGDGRTCGNCTQLWQKTNGNGVWWKCRASAGTKNDGPDIRKKWPGCLAHTFTPGDRP